MARVLPLLAVCLAACHHALPIPVDMAAPVDLARTPRDKVDVLFMMDDSASKPMIDGVRAAFPTLVAQLDALSAVGHPASYHFGVVTADLGAPGITCGQNKGGKLQGVGRGAPAGCLGPVGQSYIAYDQRDGTNNLPSGQDLPTTFSCSASVGDSGCGFEMPLEAVYRALHDDIPENVGFLRDDALLVVLYTTDEDDCSVDPSSDLFTNNPAYGNLASFRCTRFGIFCDGALVSADAPHTYSNCSPATPAQGGKLIDVQKYIDYFTLPKAKGGVKDDPRDVILAAISAPSTPVATTTGNSQDVCGSAVVSCTVLDHSCHAPSDPTNFFGDPAVRLNDVVTSVATHALNTLCQSDYAPALTDLATLIGQNLTPQ